MVSEIARVEVPAALWRKQRGGGLDRTAAQVLTASFHADLTGDPPRFASVAIGTGLMVAAARLVAVHPLRPYHAVQLASALAARKADPACTDFACFDGALRDAAAAEGLTPLP